MPAPYRFSVWDEMSKHTDLEVVFVCGENNWRSWKTPESTSWKKRYLNLNGIRFKELDLIPKFSPSWKILNDIDFVIITGWELPIYMATSALAKLRRIPIVQFYESTENTKRFKNILINILRRSVLNCARDVITISKESHESLLKLGIPQGKIHTFFNPVDVSKYFEKLGDRERINQEGHNFLYVGQLIPRKNVSSIIRAFSLIKGESNQLHIVGSGEIESELMNLVENMGLSKSVFFLGHKNPTELVQIYGDSDTLILASHQEVWGLVVNEALASGLHVVLSKHCTVSELVGSMQGVFVTETSSDSLSKGMMESMNAWRGPILNPEIMQYTPKIFAQKVLNVIEQGSPKISFFD
jgi:glycosyltransferase involved in cell wall biosynthesis